VRTSFRAEIRPTPRQRQDLLRHAGNARWAYNWGLAQHKKTYEQWVELGKPKKWTGWKNAISLHRELNILKKLDPKEGGVPWMYDSSKAAPQEALRDLDRAFKNFLSGRTRYPKFKSKNRGIGGFRLTGTIKVDHRTFQLPIIGRVRFQPGEQGYLPWGKHSQVSVTEKAGRWFVSVVGPEVAEPPPNGKSEVGLDLGVVRLATLSDGTVIENHKALSKDLKKIKNLQREVSRKKKGSANRAKACRRLAKAHARVANVRKDVLHKITTKLAKNHGRIVIEDLKVRNMIRRGGARKKGLNRSLSDASFGEFRKLLEYKGRRYGCFVEAVPAAYTSQRCSTCGHVEKGNRDSQAEFRCLSCGFELNADVNAAINILAIAVRRKAGERAVSSSDLDKNACGEVVRPVLLTGDKQTSMKQEPGTILRDGLDWGPSSRKGEAAVELRIT
jgi:putative transposase